MCAGKAQHRLIVVLLIIHASSGSTHLYGYTVRSTIDFHPEEIADHGQGVSARGRQSSQARTTAEAGFVNEKTLTKYTTPLFFTPNEDSDGKGINAQRVVEAAPATTLANFGEIDFTDCSATGVGGTKYTDEGGTTLELGRSVTTLATGFIIDASSEVIITYTGP